MNYNFFQPQKSRKNFLNQRGFTGNEAAETMFGGAFDAADTAGSTFLDNYDFSTGDNADLQRGLGTASQMGFSNYLNDFQNQDNFVNPFGNDESVFNTSIDPGDFFRSNNAGFFDMPAGAPNQDMFDNVTQNTFTSRPATEDDVKGPDGIFGTEDDTGNVGDIIEELNPPATYEALGAQYNEEFQDTLTKLMQKEGASEDYYNALAELSAILNASKTGNLENYNTEAGTNIDDSVTRQTNANTTANTGLKTNLSTLDTALGENIDNSVVRKDSATETLANALGGNLDTYETGMTGDIKTYIDSLLANLGTYDTSQQDAINTLANTRSQNAVNEYRAIDDALRANTLGAMRAGEFGTRGASNRMLVDAAMRAAGDRQNVIGDINLQKADDLYNLQQLIDGQTQNINDLNADETFALDRETLQSQKGIDDDKAIDLNQTDLFADNEKLGLADRVDEETRGLSDEKVQDARGVDAYEDTAKTSLANTTTTQRKALRDSYATRTNQLGIDYQTRVKGLRDELANYLGSTPDQIDPIMQMAKDYVAITAEQGEAATLTAQEEYDALNQAVNMLLEEPNTFLQLKQSQIADELGEIVLGEQNYLDLMAGKFNNIDDTIAMIEGLATNDPRLDRILSELNGAKTLLDAGQAALGTNPLPSGQVAVPSFDAGAATLSLDRLSAGTGTQDDIANIQGMIDLFKDFGDVLGGLGDLFPGGDDDTSQRPATQEDVNAGLATTVGEMIST